MSLPLSALTFYRMPDQSPAAATIDALLDAFYASMTSATDYRGTAVPSTHQWVTNRQVSGVTVAVYMTAPVGTTMGLSPGIIVAGSSGAPTPTMAAPDSFTASNVLLSITRGAGAFTAWDDATPFGGTNSGYWRVAGTTWNATLAKVRTFVSQEVIFVQLIGATTTNQAWFAAGAIVEPHLTWVQSGGVDAETDDRLYGMWGSGGGSVLNGTWLSAMGAATPMAHSTSAGQTHMMVFQPGASTLFTCGRKMVFQIAATAAGINTSGGAYVGDLPVIARNTVSLQPASTRLGMLRNIYLFGLVQSGRVLRDGSDDLYHVVSADLSAASDALILNAAT